ncbi:predicted protein [Naegleria gruberi]|uniref:COX assembly mitochondrial protein n=1 Tax=Naegleria gruberi TaxID=5762 RepID=D2VA06_NAEGR|nr:uncharacterized protein NAEGRDRAFT_65694 [Naegleria gruberi]EFC46344.1 predicted protein [Naegleria gruberi]|eukprot:XP_002679088.1 predicted protein [Naegleria gruberi strain NEG-M]
MHPVVKEGDHSKECVDAMNALMECYKTRNVVNFLNPCTDKKKLLDICLDNEYETRYAQNQKEAEKVYPAFHQLKKLREEQEKKSKENRKLSAEEKAKILEREGNKV